MKTAYKRTKIKPQNVFDLLRAMELEEEETTDAMEEMMVDIQEGSKDWPQEENEELHLLEEWIYELQKQKKNLIPIEKNEFVG